MVKNEKKEKKEKNGNGSEKQWRVEARKLAKLPEEEIESRLKTMKLSKPEKVRFLWNEIEKIQEAKKSKSKKQETIPEPVLTPQKEKSQKTEKASEKMPEINENTPVVQTEEQKEEKIFKIGRVIEMSETTEISDIEGVTVYTPEKLKELEMGRMTPAPLKSRDRKRKIGDKITSTHKLPQKFLAIVPAQLIATIQHKAASGKVPEYDWVSLIAENIPQECDPRINKSLRSYLRMNANARDGLKATEQGYVCEIEIGFKKTEKYSIHAETEGVYTTVPYANLYPRVAEATGPEYVLRVMLGPLDPAGIKQGSIILGPSEGLSLLRSDNVEAVTLYAILEPVQ